MQRILTGIQSSGLPHLGNILGAILPALEHASSSQQPAHFFIADLHTLTTQRDSTMRIHYTYAATAAWLACGLDPDRHLLYRQSQLPQATELTWYLSCFAPYPMLANAHAFKEKAHNLTSIHAGLFTYPALMAADILLYHATHIPVGKDQQQHLEIARQLARSFNHHYGPILTLPQPLITQANPTIPGTDGRKMSKSYQNTLSPFMKEDELRKAVMAIPTDSKPLEAPKDPDKCFIYQLYTHVATIQAQATMRKRYLTGGYGYAAAKKELFVTIMERFAQPRERFFHYIKHPAILEQILQKGEQRAAIIANNTLAKVRQSLGYLPLPTIPPAKNGIQIAETI